jgi:hypothetical protein
VHSVGVTRSYSGSADGFGSSNNCAKERQLTGKKQPVSVSTDQINGSILLMRGQRVILDRDLAAIYGVETRTLNQAVKRNAARFPEDFMFQLTPEEAAASRSQIVILNEPNGGPVMLMTSSAQTSKVTNCNLRRSSGSSV